MPKQNYIINQFHGGINTKDGTVKSFGTDNNLSGAGFDGGTGKKIIKTNKTNYTPPGTTSPLDMPEPMLEVADNVMVDSIGQIRPCGTLSSSIAAVGAKIEPGYGSFMFSSDYKISDDSNANTDYLCIMDSANSQVVINDLNSGSNTTEVDLGTGTSCKGVYYAADGNLRVADASFDSNNKPKWYGYINRTHFDTDIDNWYVKDNDLAAPTKGFIINSLELEGVAGSSTTSLVISDSLFTSSINTKLDAGEYILTGTSESKTITSCTNATTIVTNAFTNTLSGQDCLIFPPAGTGFNLGYVSTSDGLWEESTYQVAQTFVYENNQESLLKIYDETISIEDNKSFTFAVNATHGFNERIIGGRIYIKDSTNDSSQWILLLDISLEKGVRVSLDNEYTSFGDALISETYYTLQKGINSPSIQIDTYESINGYSPEIKRIAVGNSGDGWAYACVGNRRTFLLAPSCTNADGKQEIQYDRIIYSQPNKFDTFPINNYVDIGINDGDQFIAGEIFADRLLAFKKKTLYIINIASGSDTQWYVEQQVENKGIEYPSQLIKADIGIAWVNYNGCYLYDGQKIHDLTDTIDDSEWRNDFLGTYNYIPAIGYLPKRHQLVISPNTTGTTTGNLEDVLYLYDMRTGSWTTASDSILTGKKKTNMVYFRDFIYWPVELVANTSLNVYTFTNDSSLKATTVTTREITLNPIYYSKIYEFKVTVNNTSGSPTMTLTYYTNGSSSGTNIVSSTIASGKSILTFTPTSTLTNVKTIKIKLATTSSIVNIEDISIVYRTITKRI